MLDLFEPAWCDADFSPELRRFIRQQLIQKPRVTADAASGLQKEDQSALVVFEDRDRSRKLLPVRNRSDCEKDREIRANDMPKSAQCIIERNTIQMRKIHRSHLPTAWPFLMIELKPNAAPPTSTIEGDVRGKRDRS